MFLTEMYLLEEPGEPHTAEGVALRCEWGTLTAWSLKLTVWHQGHP